MRWAGARLFAAFLLCVGAGAVGPAGAQPAGPQAPGPAALQPLGPQPVMLRDAAERIDADGLATAWVDPTGAASIEQVTRPGGPAVFRLAEPETIYRLGAQSALWLHLRLQRGREERQEWLLEVPMPVLDRVTVYQREPREWHAETAGDTLAVRTWPERGRYPFFRLNLPPGETRDVYIRLRHATAANFPLQLATASNHGQRMQLEYLALGGAFGALLLLIVGAGARGWAYRDPVFGWYAVYASLSTLAVATYTGTAAHLLWPGFDALQDAPMPMLACFAVGVALLFVRHVLALRRRLPRLDRAMLWLALLGFALALLPPFAPKSISAPPVGIYMSLATIAALVVSATAWRRGDAAAKWVFWAYVPMAVAVVVSVARVFGWAPVSPTQYAVVAAMAVEVPLMLVALFLRSRDRHSAEVREQALSTQDALTGLLAPHLFTDRLRQVVARHRRDGLSAAVMYIELVNHPRIREYYGNSVADQSLLRSVIKLRRLLRDADTVSRVDEARFGVLLEGAASRASVTERATRLIAAGLMPLPGLKPDVTLQFHVAAVMLNETPMEAEELEAALRAQLARMGSRTRRPIRFIEVEPAPPSDPADSSVFVHLGEEPGGKGDFAPAP